MEDRELIGHLQEDDRIALRQTMEIYAGYASAVLGNTLKG